MPGAPPTSGRAEASGGAAGRIGSGRVWARRAGRAALAAAAGSVLASVGLTAASLAPAPPRELALAALAGAGAGLAWAVVWAPLAAVWGLVCAAAWGMGAVRGGAIPLAPPLFLVCAEAGLAWAAAHYARHHHLAPAAGRLGLGLLAGGVACAVLALGWRRLPAPARRALPAAAWALVALTPGAIHLAWPAHVRAQPLAAWLLLAAAWLPLVAARGRASRRPAWAALAVGAAGLSLLAFALPRLPGVASSLVQVGHVEPVLTLGQALTDFDHDGAAAWFGGRDCAPTDPRVGPAKAEVAGNGVDDNCLEGDLPDDAIPAAVASGARLPGLARPNVLVIVVDALRPDRMSIYGYERPTTPNLERHFAAATRFVRAYSPAASTRDTTASLLTGRDVVEVWWDRHDAVVLAPENLLVPRVLAAAGVRTSAVLPFVALNMMGSPDLGFAFERVYDDRRPRPASQALRMAREVVPPPDDGAAPAPWFSWVHIYEPHEPYVRHRRHARVSEDPYDQEVAAADAAVGALLDRLEAAGELERTVVFLLADHGEAFGEHGHRFHDRGVHEEDVRVPLLVRVPGGTARVVDTPVTTASLATTVLDLLGVDLDAAGPPTAPSLAPALLGRAPAPARAVLTVAGAGLPRERFAAVVGDRKILFDRALTRFQVHDLAADPGETRGLVGHDPGVVGSMVELAAELLERRLGAAESRLRRRLQHDEVPPAARREPVALAPGVTFLGAIAERTRAPGVPAKLPARVIVRAFFRVGPDAAPFSYRAAVEDGAGGVAQVVSGPAPGPRFDPSQWPPGSILEDRRTFKVYAPDEGRHVTLHVAGTRLDLGAVRGLPVATWATPP